jgi:hypothetical protein
MNDEIESKGLVAIKDLWGIDRFTKAQGKVLDERATLIKFFADEMHREPRHLGVRLHHYSLTDLYALKSTFLDRKNRNGIEPAHRYFWWITKTIEVPASIQEQAQG